jgi:cysteinyl-tRNA synthetase
MEEAERRVEYLYRTKLRLADIPEARIVPNGPASAELLAFPSKLGKALEDDLNLPVALAELAELLKNVNELVERALAKKGQVPRASVDAAGAGLARVGDVLGLGNAQAKPLLDRIRARRAARIGITEADVEAQIKARAQARIDRDFASADGIRKALLERGIELMDGPEGTSWRID